MFGDLFILLPCDTKIGNIMHFCLAKISNSGRYSIKDLAKQLSSEKTSMKRLYKGVDLGYFGESKNPVYEYNEMVIRF